MYLLIIILLVYLLFPCYKYVQNYFEKIYLNVCFTNKRVKYIRVVGICVCVCVGNKGLITRVSRIGKRKVRANLVEMGVLK